MPPDGIDAETVELVYDSRAPLFPWYDRIDPIHEIGWSDTTRSFWEDVSVYRHRLAVDRTGHLSHDVEHTVSPVHQPPARVYGPRAMRVVALLHQWSQLTTFQLSCMLGEARQSVWRTTSALFAAGVLRRMIPEWWSAESGEDYGGSGSLWCLNRMGWTLERWLEHVPHLEWALITNGSSPQEGTAGEIAPSALRHNLAAAEICIRAIEASPVVIGAWGERFTDGAMFADVSTDPMEQTRSNIGDGAIVSRDGKVVVLELSGSNRIGTSPAGPRIAEKAAAWTSICGRSPLDISVVFVDISASRRWGMFSTYVETGVNSVSARYASRADVLERGRSRVMAVDARTWFPISRGISTAFQRLTSWSPYARREVDLLDPSSAVDPSQEMVVNTLGSLHTPHWVAAIPDHSW